MATPNRRPDQIVRAKSADGQHSTPAGQSRGTVAKEKGPAPFPRPARDHQPVSTTGCLMSSLTQDDLDAAVLRLAHTVGSLDQRAALAERLRGDRIPRHAQTDELSGNVSRAAL